MHTEVATRASSRPPRVHQHIQVLIARELERFVRLALEQAAPTPGEARRVHPLFPVIARRTVDQVLMQNLTSFITPRARTRRAIYEVLAWVDGELEHVGYIQADGTRCSSANGPVRIAFVHLNELEDEPAIAG